MNQGDVKEMSKENMQKKEMEKKELQDILNHLYDHYNGSDLEDEQREDIEMGYKKITKLIQKS